MLIQEQREDERDERQVLHQSFWSPAERKIRPLRFVSRQRKVSRDVKEEIRLARPVIRPSSSTDALVGECGDKRVGADWGRGS